MVDAVKVVLFKKETTYATDSTPLVGANAILTRNFSAKPIEGDRLERPLDRGTYGANPSATSNERQTRSFEVELAGSGAAGTAPRWMELLEACGMAAPVLTAATKAEQKFALVNAVKSSGTMYDWVGNQLRKGVGTRGTFSLDFTAGAYPFLQFNMTSLIPAATPYSVSAPGAADFSAWQGPLEVNTDNTAVLLDSYGVIMRSLRLDAGVQANIRNLVGSRSVNVGNHAVTGSMVIEAPSIAVKDFIQTLRVGSLVPLSVIHGTVAGNIIELAAPKLQITDITESVEDDKLMWTLAITATVDAGADDLVITAK